MIIKDVRLNRTKNGATLSATCKIRKFGWDEIFFKVSGPGTVEYVYEDFSPFAAALLIPAMKQGETLRVKGAMSKQLYEGMKSIMPVVLSWNIGLKLIKVVADKLVKDDYRPRKNAAFFSGGVDSFYTYLKHKHDGPANRVNSFILVKGFDIDPRNDALWRTTVKNIKAIAKQEGIELIIVETNVRQIIEPIMPRGDYTHGGCLAAVGLFLRNNFKQIYIPSTFSVAEQVPWGSHMNVDKHWSTEKTSYIHDGTEATRLEKIISQIAKSPVALEHLRVCYMNVKSVYNCGKCDKCIRTMLGLYVAGALEKTKTFPDEIDLDLVAAGPHANPDGVYIYHGELDALNRLKAKGLNPLLQEALETKIEKIKNMSAGFSGKAKLEYARFYLKVVYFDFAYTKSILYGILSKPFGKKFA